MNKNYRSGMALLGMSIALSVVGIGVAFGISWMSVENVKQVGKEIRGTKADLALKEGLAVGSYLVAHGLVLCREGGWGSLPNKPTCQWGADLWPGHDTSAQQYRLSEEGYADDGSLILSLDMDKTRINDTPGENKVRLYFNLGQWRGSGKDEALASVMGSIDRTDVDKDDFVVKMGVEVSYLTGDTKESKTAKVNGLLRRPASSLSLSMNSSAICNSVCIPGQTENPSPQCMGPFEVPDESNVTVDLSLYNPGPGPVYRAKYQRNIGFEEGLGNEDIDSPIDVMGAQEVLMPGASIVAADNIPCFAPAEIQQTRYSYNQRTQTVVSQHSEPMAQISYNLDSSGIEPSRLMAEPEDVEGTTLEKTTVTVTNIIYVSPPH